MGKSDLHFIVDEDFNLFNLGSPIQAAGIKPLIFIHSKYRKSTPTKAWDYFDHSYFNPDHSENRKEAVLYEGQEGIMKTAFHDVCEIEKNGIKFQLGCSDNWGPVGHTSQNNVMITADVWDKSGEKRRFKFQQFSKGNRETFQEFFSYLRELKILNSHKEVLKKKEFKHLRD